MKNKLNHKKRKKMRRKIIRRDQNWETILGELVKYEIKNTKGK